MNKIKPIIAIFLLCQVVKVASAQVPATWTVNPSAYTYQMSVTCKANEACVDLLNPNNYVAAFVGTQCRGVAKTNTAFNSSQLGLMTIKSNSVSGEKVKFKIYNSISNAVLNVLDSISFSQGASLGTLNTPFVLYTNHVPTDISISNYTITENSPLATIIATLTAVDQDAGTVFNYSLTTAQPENNQFAINGSNLTVNSLFDFETDSIKVIQLQVDDNGGCKYVETFTIHIINGNDAPTALTFTSPLISDGQQAQSYMGQFSTTDPDAVDSHTYTLIAGSGSTDNTQFYIQRDSLYNVSAIYFPTQPVYYIRARTTDLGGLWIENTFTINVSNVNHAPSDIALSNTVIAENQLVGTSIATLTTSDADILCCADTHTYTLVSGSGSADNAKVYVVGNILKTNQVLDFESQNSLTIRLMTTDALGGATFTKSFTLTVTDNNDAPTNLLLSGDSIYELSPTATLVATLTTTDQDAVDAHTYSLVPGAGDTDNSKFAVIGNQLQSAQTFTFTNQLYSIRLRTTDLAGATFEKTVTIKVLNVNDPPTDIIIDTLFVLEDNAANIRVSNIKSIDLDSPETFTFALVSGSGSADNSQFDIIGNQLFIATKTNYDVKNAYYIRVKSTDAGGLSTEKAFEISIIDIAGNTIPLPSTNYISPNNDGKNDFWKIDNVEIYKTFSLRIFDQFGQIIFEVPENYNNEFDGKYKGSPLPTGNYYYILQKDKKQFKGNITVVN
jgi:gliding motility-associated-like protein